MTSGRLPIQTPRLRLRQWRDADVEAFARINADPEVMRYFPAPIGAEASARSIDTWRRQIAERGWSNWAVERADSGEFIGFVGLTVSFTSLVNRRSRAVMSASAC